MVFGARGLSAKLRGLSDPALGDPLPFFSTYGRCDSPPLSTFVRITTHSLPHICAPGANLLALHPTTGYIKQKAPPALTIGLHSRSLNGRRRQGFRANYQEIRKGLPSKALSRAQQKPRGIAIAPNKKARDSPGPCFQKQPVN